MKKLVLSLLCLLIVGCSSNTISKEEYEKVVEENLHLESQMKELKSSYDDLEKSYLELKEKSMIHDVEISGGFVATVRDVMIDNCVDDFTLHLVLLQWFQGDTFVLKMDEDVAKKIKVGKTYYFEIEPYVVEKDSYEMSVEEVEKMLSGSITVNDWVKIKDYRDIKEDEGGLNSDFITIEAIK